MDVKKFLLALLITSATIFSMIQIAKADDLIRKSSSANTDSTNSYLNAELQISNPTSPECDRYKPAIAYNWQHDEYLIVWHNAWPGGNSDIYARRVSGDGQLLSWFAVSAGSNDRLQPSVAYNADTDEYLVVWMYNASGDGTTYDIWGRTVAWNGAYQDPEFQIITFTNRTFWTPHVVWNGLHNEYLVVWNAYNATTFQPTDIAHAILDKDGNKVYGTIISSVDMPHYSDVTYNIATDEYLVVWRYLNGANGNIRAARVSATDGVIVNPPGVFVISSASDDEQYPAVTTNEQHRYLVVWQKFVLGDWDIYGRELDVTGNLLDGEILLAINAAVDEMYPDVAARPGTGRDYLAVWQRSSASGEEIKALHWGDGDAENIDIAAAAFWDYEEPVVAWGNLGSFFAYEGNGGAPVAIRHIYGRRWVPNAIFMPLLLKQ